MKNYPNEIIFEQYFPANISKDLQHILLDLIEKTVELSDSIYPINGITNGQLISLVLKASDDKDIIYMSGFYNIDIENRCLEGEIYLLDNKIYIDSLITRLGENILDSNKKYRSLDKFTILKTKINHESLCKSKLLKKSYPIIKQKVKKK